MKNQIMFQHYPSCFRYRGNMEQLLKQRAYQFRFYIHPTTEDANVKWDLFLKSPLCYFLYFMYHWKGHSDFILRLEYTVEEFLSIQVPVLRKCVRKQGFLWLEKKSNDLFREKRLKYKTPGGQLYLRQNSLQYLY